ncbi:GspS/AspS pilotin family protein [Vibrio sinaloensis]|uniref:GspS/AspS pilotin family protein n=1 Tax=Photobacterium sp. (strain ATCC 43367) TaxID=379097 RepID=UPI00204D66BC|nr:GspS/AspS pilotin family protein [Vibrio sinaloensis]UPQ86959.1 GspS/AspS pilotin family protein [Vibrio sinaloensis]
MRFSLRPVACIALASMLLAGCSSADAERQRHLAMVAESRANLLAAELPIEAGPLSILRANANQTTIEIMMVYNQDAKGAKPIKQVLNSSIRTYCTHPDTQKNLDVGLSYRVKMRNSRGQLMADELITKQRCGSIN